MLLLESHDTAGNYSTFDRLTLNLKESNLPKGASQSIQAVDGHFSHMGERLLALYRDDGALYFRADDLEIPLTENTKVAWTEYSKTENRLQIIREGIVQFDWIYPRPYSLPASFNPIAFGVADEDFDFGLFVSNVFNDNGRRRRIYSHDKSLYE
ncbi:hypothetical protein FBQ82_06690 [Anaerolineae bacterium CFX7]|mgnify:CR=1 FL=1|nr:hypothetical protein [Anaerolineae bacterium CFX7]